jgi:hypothetical protein
MDVILGKSFLALSIDSCDYRVPITCRCLLLMVVAVALPIPLVEACQQCRFIFQFRPSFSFKIEFNAQTATDKKKKVIKHHVNLKSSI